MSTVKESTMATTNDDVDVKTYFGDYLNRINEGHARYYLSAKSSGTDGVECLLGHFPNGTQHLLGKMAKIERGPTRNEGFMEVLNFLRVSATLMTKDTEYDYDLWKTLVSACCLALEYSANKKNDEVIYLIFYIALLQEGLARGIGFVGAWIAGTAGYNYRLHESGECIVGMFPLDKLFAKFAHHL